MAAVGSLQAAGLVLVGGGKALAGWSNGRLGRLRGLFMMELGGIGTLLGIILIPGLIIGALFVTARAGDGARLRLRNHFASALETRNLEPNVTVAVDMPPCPGQGCGLWLEAPDALPVALRVRLLRDGEALEQHEMVLHGSDEDGGFSPLAGTKAWPWDESPRRCAMLICRRPQEDSVGQLAVELYWTVPPGQPAPACRLYVTSPPQC